LRSDIKKFERKFLTLRRMAGIEIKTIWNFIVPEKKAS